MEKLVERINELKKQKNAVIMAHYYVEDKVQEIADYIGDSYYLSDMATKIDADIIVLCGVRFMGESAKVLNPDKKVFLPASDSDCPMAHMATVKKVQEVRAKYEDVAVVCYVNSTAQLKAASDVCVTSANALNIVEALPNRNIYFIPDQNLARYIQDKLPQKNFIFNEGYCYIHNNVSVEEINQAKLHHPQAQVLVHPECKPEVTALADYIGSTSGIIKYATQSDSKEFIVVTELGVMHELKRQNPDKSFYAASDSMICENMKKINLENVLEVLENETSEVHMESDMIDKAHKPLKRMLELAK